MSIHHGLRSAAGASVADPYFANTSLLLLGNGTNGGQNNSFVDGSSNAFSVTRYGNTTQGTFSPFGYNWSNYFDGSDDYLQYASTSTLNFGTGDFTVECWINLSNTSGSKGILSGTATNSFGFRYGTGYTTSNGLNIYKASTADCEYCSYTFSPGVWYHVAVVRASGVIKFFVNGTQQTTQGSGAASYNYGSETNVRVGLTDYVGGPESFAGHISNLRVVKSAVYSSNFTPPTNNLTAITNTTLLTCQSNRFQDNSSNAFSLTSYGTVNVTNFAPFATGSEYSTGTNGGSGYFDGTGDYLDTAYNSAFSLGTEFTIEAWVYFPSTPSSNATRIIGLGDGASGSTTYTAWSVRCESGGLSFYRYDGTEYTYSSSSNLTIGAWNHVCVVRNSSNNFAIFLNGTRTYSGTVSQSFGNVNTNALFIGRMLAGGGPTAYFLNGYISSLRVVKGTAVYDPTQTTLTVPTTPLTAITNTSLLLNFVNGSIIDSTGKNDLETVGDAQISTSTKKYGTGSLKFDGTGDGLIIPQTDNLKFGTGDFTVEFWLYLNANQSNFTKYFSSGTATGSFVIDQQTVAGKITVNDNNTVLLTSSSTVSNTTWTHVAVVRSGTTMTMYFDGVSVGSVTDSTNFTSGISSVGSNSTGGSSVNGYMDDFRATKGVARYTAAFTPPTRQLPAR